VLINERRQNSDGEWVDAELARHVVRAFKTWRTTSWSRSRRGDRVFVHGTVTTDAWTDKQTSVGIMGRGAATRVDIGAGRGGMRRCSSYS
jgi:single-stranded DNA-binding protein